MGDRLDIEFIYDYSYDGKEEKGSIHFYSHWQASWILDSGLKQAIEAAKSRWGDQNYCARIIMSQLIQEQWTKKVSWGISPFYSDSEYPELTIDLKRSIVTHAGLPFTFQEITDAEEFDFTTEVKRSLSDLEYHSQCRWIKDLPDDKKEEMLDIWR